MADENAKLRNIGARLASCLWDVYGLCPECGNDRSGHMLSCGQVYQKEWKTPADFQKVFNKAFDLE